MIAQRSITVKTGPMSIPLFPAGDDAGRLRLAVQKKGRLSDDTFDLLRQCGLRVSQSRTRLYARVSELPIDLLLVRDDDIPGLVAEGASDIGIIGGNVFEEERLGAGDRDWPVEAVISLGFSECRLCIAVPKEEPYGAPSDLEGKRIATSYPEITRRWLTENNVSTAKPVIMNGAHEIAPRLGVSEAICDIVSTGGTLDANGLKVAETIYHSEAILIKARHLSPEKCHTLEALRGRIEGVIRSAQAKYVMMNAPAAAVERIRHVLPGAEAPTVIDLAGESDKVALHVVCNEDVLWDHLAELKSLGASAILVLDIDKMLA